MYIYIYACIYIYLLLLLWTKYLAIFRQPYFQGSKVWQQLLGKSHHVRVYIAYSDFEAKDFIHLGVGMETIKKPQNTNNSIKLSWFMNMFEIVGILDGLDHCRSIMGEQWQKRSAFWFSRDVILWSYDPRGAAVVVLTTRNETWTNRPVILQGGDMPINGKGQRSFRWWPKALQGPGSMRGQGGIWRFCLSFFGCVVAFVRWKTATRSVPCFWSTCRLAQPSETTKLWVVLTIDIHRKKGWITLGWLNNRWFNIHALVTTSLVLQVHLLEM